MKASELLRLLDAMSSEEKRLVLASFKQRLSREAAQEGFPAVSDHPPGGKASPQSPATYRSHKGHGTG